MSSHETVKAVLILDIIGRPAEHLTETLKRIVEEMGKEPGTKVVSKDIKEPTVMKDNKDFFTTFSEVEIETEDIYHLAGLMFKYMPANIEVISPESISLTNNGWSDILSELVRRLHSYDEVARLMQIENQKLVEKFKEISGKGKVKEEKKD